MTVLRQQTVTQPIRTSFANALEISEDDPEFFMALGLLLAPPAEVEGAVRKHVNPEYHSLYLCLFWKAPIANALRQGQSSLSGRTSDTLSQYEDEHVRSLLYVSGLLAQAKIEDKVDRGEIVALLEQIEELQKAVLAAAGVPADLKSWISLQLDRLRQALREMHIRGPLAAAEVVEQFVGSAVVHRELLEDANEESQSFLERLGEIFGVAEKFGKAADAIGTGVVKAITAGGIVAAIVTGALIPPGPPLSPPAITQGPADNQQPVPDASAPNGQSNSGPIATNN